MLLGQIESLDSQRLLIVSSGGLQYVHFAALPVPAREVGDAKPKSSAGKVPLLKYHEIETPPSMSVLAELKNEKRNASDSKAVKTLAVIADPVFNADDDRFNTVRSHGAPSNRGNGSSTSPAKASELVTRAFKDGRVPRLIFSRREAEAILSIVPPGEGDKIVDFDASLKFVTGPRKLSQYRYVHIATHGLIDYDSPELSALLLSLYDDQRQQQEGLLQMHEIYNLSIPVEMVVLSACGTGAGNDMKGEGLASLSRAFVYAGARRVVASLWEVGDSSTAELMKTFYRKLLIDQDRPAAALRAAQLEMWNKNPDESPYDWAAFFTYGDPYFERMKTKTANVGPGVQGDPRP
jgi:CHAT domain-containing protein